MTQTQPVTHYAEWTRTYDELPDAARAAIRDELGRFPESIEFLLVPLVRSGDAPALWLPTARSAAAQLYGKWRFFVPDAWSNLFATLFETTNIDTVPFPRNEAEGDRGVFLRSVLDKITGAEDRFILPLLPGAILNERLLYEYAAAVLRHEDAQFLYADEDELDGTGERCFPYFKTGFDPELMLGRDALGSAIAVRQDLFQRLGGLRPECGPIRVTIHDLCLRASELASSENFMHVPMVLQHRMHRPPGALPEWDAFTARRAVQHHLDAVGDSAIVHPAPLAPAWCRVTRSLPDDLPLVSVIVPTRDRANLLARCAEAVLTRTDYPAVELLIVDNDSREQETLELFEKLIADQRVRILSRPGPFNYSALNNSAVNEARGEILLLLNNDIDVLGPDWLREMVAQALRPDVGAVGAKLLYEDGRVQHAGVVLAPGPLLSHQLRLSGRDDPGQHGELALARTVLAVTGACLAIRRTVFQEVGGLDESSLRVSFNDIDLCLRLGDHGYRNVWTPFAELLHLESASRGSEDAGAERVAEYQRELATIRQRWAPELRTDPFHNPNILFGWDGTRLATPPRRDVPWLAQPPKSNDASV
ncbi:family 2 glycosyl transferase (plasmid) [Roseomonas sp. FDAARGOS_362]|uniref:glycosyltransferase family 2 protein n=1 Tax=Roseomonas sp. FDAARGOS_362 TaxID=2018065 RepID=UPI000C187C41|nr:glycosyltransferase family 2 protein [Roseomonas sp. FDAARGOS_362]ATR19518.1 family 2 glycosyl transferase [Roseomonas sp. FDAARGOS_362]